MGPRHLRGNLVEAGGRTFVITKTFFAIDKTKGPFQHSLTGEDLLRYSCYESKDGELSIPELLGLPTVDEYGHIPSKLRLFMSKKNKQVNQEGAEEAQSTTQKRAGGKSWILARLLNETVMGNENPEDRKNLRKALKEVDSWEQFTNALETAGIVGEDFNIIMNNFFDRVRK